MKDCFTTEDAEISAIEDRDTVDAGSEFATNIYTMRDQFSQLFDETPDHFPNLNRVFSAEEQRKNETRIGSFLKQTSSFVSRHGNGYHGGEAELLVTATVKNRVRLLLGESLSSSQHGVDNHFFDPWFDSADDFIQRARQFDRQLSGEDIYQALRNIWICNSVQVYLGKQVAITPPAFAYSMLYPYTDNYLDDPAVSKTEKEQFVAIIRDMLCGVSTPVSTPALKKIRTLIAMIETEFPRAQHQPVYGSLLAIHHAQGKSITEQMGQSAPDPVNNLNISIEKGGTSVLADAYLIAGTLDDDIAAFMFGFGVVLQLIDDMQDIGQDSLNRHTTLFTRSADAGSFEQTTNRLFNFSRSILGAKDIFPSQEGKTLINLSLTSCTILMFEAIACNAEYCTPSYLERLEPFSPLRFESLREMKGKFQIRNSDFEIRN